MKRTIANRHFLATCPRTETERMTHVIIFIFDYYDINIHCVLNYSAIVVQMRVFVHISEYHSHINIIHRDSVVC